MLSFRRAVLGTVAAVGLAFVAAAIGAPKAQEGSLQQLSGKAGCYTDNGADENAPGTCKDITGGTLGTDLTLSPDGHFAYLASYGDFHTVPPVLSIFKVD